MKFASFIHAGRAGWGLVDGDSVADLSGVFPDLKSAIAADGLTFAASRAAASSTGVFQKAPGASFWGQPIIPESW